jgi:hypothetical protein
MLLIDARVVIDNIDVVSRLDVTLGCSVPNWFDEVGDRWL